MSKKISYAGILLAINIILLSLLNFIPMNTLFLMALASLSLSIIIMEFGPKTGGVFYLASVILSFIIMSNKIHWVIYSFTFGLYGLIKYIIESDRPMVLEYILKIIFANIVILLTYIILKPFVYVPINIFSILLFEVIFLIYDRAYSMFIEYYNDKLIKIIKINK